MKFKRTERIGAIVKILSDNPNKIFTLSREECKILHIKYEDGLQVWPMDLNWIDLTAKKNRKKSCPTHMPWLLSINRLCFRSADKRLNG